MLQVVRLERQQACVPFLRLQPYALWRADVRRTPQKISRLQVVNALPRNDANVKMKRAGVILERKKAAGNGLVPSVHCCAPLHPVAKANASV